MPGATSFAKAMGRPHGDRCIFSLSHEWPGHEVIQAAATFRRYCLLLTHRKRSASNTSRTAALVAGSVFHKRLACSRVSESPGISQVLTPDALQQPFVDGIGSNRIHHRRPPNFSPAPRVTPLPTSTVAAGRRQNRSLPTSTQQQPHHPAAPVSVGDRHLPPWPDAREVRCSLSGRVLPSPSPRVVVRCVDGRVSDLARILPCGMEGTTSIGAYKERPGDWAGSSGCLASCS